MNRNLWLCNTFEPRHDKTNKVTVHPAKTQISLGIRRPGWSESSLCAQWVAKDPSFLHADSEDSVQTGRMPRLIWVFAGRTVIFLVLSWGGSNLLLDYHHMSLLWCDAFMHLHQACAKCDIMLLKLLRWYNFRFYHATRNQPSDHIDIR